MHGASVSRIYGIQSDRLAEEGSFLPSNIAATSENALNAIKRVVGCRTAERKQGRLQLSSLLLYEGLCVNLSVLRLVCACDGWFLAIRRLCEDAWYRNKVAEHS